MSLRACFSQARANDDERKKNHSANTRAKLEQREREREGRIRSGEISHGAYKVRTVRTSTLASANPMMDLTGCVMWPGFPSLLPSLLLSYLHTRNHNAMRESTDGKIVLQNTQSHTISCKSSSNPHRDSELW